MEEVNLAKNKSGRGACPRLRESGGKPPFLTCSSQAMLFWLDNLSRQIQ